MNVLFQRAGRSHPSAEQRKGKAKRVFALPAVDCERGAGRSRTKPRRRSPIQHRFMTGLFQSRRLRSRRFTGFVWLEMIEHLDDTRHRLHRSDQPANLVVRSRSPKSDKSTIRNDMDCARMSHDPAHARANALFQDTVAGLVLMQAMPGFDRFALQAVMD